jgi:hypothetical protein
MSGDIAQMKSMSIDIVQRKLRSQSRRVTKLHEITEVQIENEDK